MAKKTEIMSFKDVYKWGFFTDPYGIYIFCGENGDASLTALDTEGNTEEDFGFMKDLCRVLNGEYVDREFDVKTDYAGVIEFWGEAPIRARGWGYLRSRFLNLTERELAEIQDQFIEWVLLKIELNNAQYKLKKFEENANEER